MKALSKTVFGLYLFTLLWLVLFKFSFDIFGVLMSFQTNSLNLIPFADTQGNMREMIDNFAVFIPFGLLLSVVFKQTSFWRKLAFICAFSFAVEVIQFILAIGATDITDLVMNTLGGLAGLALYKVGAKYIDNKKLDSFITVASGVLMVAFLVWRVFFLQVRY